MGQASSIPHFPPTVGTAHCSSARRRTRTSRRPGGTAGQHASRSRLRTGQAFTHLKSAQPRASDDEIKRSIIAAVRFEDACFKYFVQDGTDYWERCVRAVALAAKQSPGYLESTCQLARNDVAYYMK
jgi:hypothetical protein